LGKPREPCPDARPRRILTNFFVAPTWSASRTLYAMRRKALLPLLAGLAGLATAPAAALASNAAATQAYVQADYALVHVANSHLATSEAAPLHTLAQVTRECPQAGVGSPQDPESTEMSDEVIGAMVIGAAQPDLQAIKTFERAVAGLSWSDRALTSAVRAYVGDLKTVLSLAAPNLCASVRAWAADGYRSLPPSTVAFVAKFMPAWVALGYLPAQLARYESSGTKALASRAGGLEQLLTEGEARAVEHWGDIMNELVLNP
jgi:hypothetical protein